MCTYIYQRVHVGLPHTAPATNTLYNPNFLRTDNGTLYTCAAPNITLEVCSNISCYTNAETQILLTIKTQKFLWFFNMQMNYFLNFILPAPCTRGYNLWIGSYFPKVHAFSNEVLSCLYSTTIVTSFRGPLTRGYQTFNLFTDPLKARLALPILYTSPPTQER